VPLESGEFRLLSRRVVATLRSLRETHQSPRALIAWAGFRQATVEFDRLTAEKKVGFGELLSRALGGIGAFSTRPLRLATWAGALLGVCSIAFGIVAVVVGFGVGSAVILLLFSIQFLLIGILGEYVGRIYEQVKRRPLYVVAQRIGFGSKKRVETLATRDIEELPSFPRTPSAPPVLPQRASKPPSEVPPPPPAVIAAGAAAERAISQPRQRAASVPPPERPSVTPPPPPSRPSVTPAPPPATGSAKPPPLKLSSSLGSMPAAPAVPERASTPPVPPRRPSFASIPHPAAVPTQTPSTPPVLGQSRVSRPPSLPKFPAAPSGPPRPPSVSRMPALPRPEAAPAAPRTPSNAPPTDEKKG
jgi:hypothetical protein